MSINLSFGNPSRDLLKSLREESYLDSLLKELKNYPPPAYDSPEQEQEIAQLVVLTDSLQSDLKSEQRFKYYDTDFDKYIIKVMVNAGINEAEIKDLILNIEEDTKPLLIKLKYNYQRVRPIQLSLYFNSPLFPYPSNTANTPAYPSGHAFQSKLYCEVIGNKYPQFYQSLQNLAEDISISRLYLGLHYQSDIDFAKYCSELVLNHPDFIKKYKL